MLPSAECKLEILESLYLKPVWQCCAHWSVYHTGTPKPSLTNIGVPPPRTLTPLSRSQVYTRTLLSFLLSTIPPSSQDAMRLGFTQLPIREGPNINDGAMNFAIAKSELQKP